MGLGVRGLASPHPFLGATRVVDKGGMYKAGVAGVLHFTLCSFWLVTGPDARRSGLFGPEGQLCSVLVDGSAAFHAMFPLSISPWLVWTRRTIS